MRSAPDPRTKQDSEKNLLRLNGARPILTVACSKDVLECGSVDVKTDHSVTFTVHVLERSDGAHVQLTDAIVTHVDVCQSLKHAEVGCLVDRQHELVHS